jgi:hypothetical protein
VIYPPNNILFHRDNDRMYIGICDWGFSCRIDSPRIYPTNSLMERWKKQTKLKPSNFGWIPHYLLSMNKKNLNIAWKQNYL